MLLIRPVSEIPSSSSSGRWMSEDGRYLIMRGEKGRHWHLEGRDKEARAKIDSLAKEDYPSRQAASEALAALLGFKGVEVSNHKGQLPLLIIEASEERHVAHSRPPKSPAPLTQLSLSFEKNETKLGIMATLKKKLRLIQNRFRSRTKTS
jgi:hypothetical protein